MPPTCCTRRSKPSTTSGNSFADTFFSNETKAFLSEWQPIKAALNHRPFNPESAEHRAFLEKTHQKLATLKARYPEMEI